MTDKAQIAFWRGSFGDRYTDRNHPADEIVDARRSLWARILDNFTGQSPARILEVGANLGSNLRALGMLTQAELHGVEPNREARRQLIADSVLPADNIHDAVASDLPFADGFADLAFTSGVLIHIHPDDLLDSCAEIHRVAGRYIVCIEYFSDKAQEVEYGGQRERLFKRDFGSFWLDNFPDLEVLDYGFAWKRVTGLDNLTWWVLRKKS
jgi:pseudaminic acid biosynthesis-associated methylase